MKRPTRIGMISEHASPAALIGGEDAGGQNVYVDEVSRHLARLGYSVDVFTRRNRCDLPEVIHWAPGVRVINLDAGEPRAVPKDELWPVMPAFVQDFLRFMLRDGVRYDLLHGNFWMSGWAAVQLARRLHVPTTQTFHALGVTKRRQQGDADSSPTERVRIERQIVQRMSRLIAQCPCERAELLHDYGADSGKIDLVPAGVNTNRFRPVERGPARTFVGIESDVPVIAYIGRLLPRKDVRNIVRALGILKTRIQQGRTTLTQVPKLLVVGGESPEPDPVRTPEIGGLQRLASELGVREDVVFTGQEHPDNLCFYYSAADAVVTTPWYEPFGLTPLEAMACKRPVIGSSVGGLRFTISDNQTGYLVPPRDPETLSNRLERMLGHPDVTAQMGQLAYQRIHREFRWDVVAERIAGHYDEMLSGTRTPRLSGGMARR